jgi:hypothetical protein
MLGDFLQDKANLLILHSISDNLIQLRVQCPCSNSLICKVRKQAAGKLMAKPLVSIYHALLSLGSTRLSYVRCRAEAHQDRQ